MDICDTNNCDATIPARYAPFGFTVRTPRCESKRDYFWRLNRAGCAALAREVEAWSALEYRQMDSHEDAPTILASAGVPESLHEAVWENFVDECIEALHYAPRVASCWVGVFSQMESY